MPSAWHAAGCAVYMQMISMCGFACLCVCVSQWPKVLNASLAEVDPELFDIIEKEKNRQYKVGD